MYVTSNLQKKRLPSARGTELWHELGSSKDVLGHGASLEASGQHTGKTKKDLGCVREVR